VLAFTFTESLGEGRLFLAPLDGFLFERWRPWDLRHEAGASFILGLGLYPYVYLSCLVAMSMPRAAQAIEAARLMTGSPWRLFAQVGLPMLRIPILVGLSLVAMEILNDYGVASLYAVPTLTWAIIDSWTAMASLPTSFKLSCLLILLVLPFVLLERMARFAKGGGASRGRGLSPKKVTSAQGWSMTFLLTIPVIAGFVLPILVLFLLQPSFSLPDGLMNSFLLALMVGAAVVASAGLVEWWRIGQGPWASMLGQAAMIGYAVPAASVAMGVLALSQVTNGFVAGLFGLWLALTFRFATLGSGQLGQVMAGNLRLHDERAMLMGAGFFLRLRLILLPLLRKPAGLTLILVMVDVLKELPATFLLRPFGFDTLATVIFTSASLENYGDAAMPALLLVLVSLLAVLLVFPPLNRRG
jgi:iron(III) transport system permease protein